MTKFAIDLPETHVVTSRDRHVTVDIGKLPVEIVARLAIHGLTQKVADSAASAGGLARVALGDGADKTDVDAKAAEIGLAAMEQVVENLMNGVWGAMRAASGVTPLQSALRNVCRNLLVPSLNDAGKTKWKEMDADARNAKLDEIIAKQEPATLAAWTEQAEADIAAALARKAATEKLAAKVGKTLTL